MIWGYIWDNGKENGNYYVFRVYIGFRIGEELCEEDIN